MAPQPMQDVEKRENSWKDKELTTGLEKRARKFLPTAAVKKLHSTMACIIICKALFLVGEERRKDLCLSVINLSEQTGKECHL